MVTAQVPSPGWPGPTCATSSCRFAAFRIIRRAGSVNGMVRLPLQFLGANGFPCAAYRPVLQALSKNPSISAPSSTEKLLLDVTASDVFYSMEGERDWRRMRNALIKEIESRKEPVIGVGHSFGGALMICAASSRPELFRKLIIVGTCSRFVPRTRYLYYICWQIRRFSISGNGWRLRCHLRYFHLSPIAYIR